MKTEQVLILSNRLLEAGKDESVVRTQDLLTMVRYVSYNPLGQTMAWDWVTLNWDYLVDRSVRAGLSPDRHSWSVQGDCPLLVETELLQLNVSIGCW